MYKTGNIQNWRCTSWKYTKLEMYNKLLPDIQIVHNWTYKNFFCRNLSTWDLVLKISTRVAQKWKRFVIWINGSQNISFLKFRFCKKRKKRGATRKRHMSSTERRMTRTTNERPTRVGTIVRAGFPSRREPFFQWIRPNPIYRVTRTMHRTAHPLRTNGPAQIAFH